MRLTTIQKDENMDTTDEPDFTKYTPEEIENISNNLKEPGIVLTATAMSGGNGKTTVSVCTASTLAQTSQRATDEGSGYPALKVAVVDMDTRDGQLREYLTEDTGKSVTTVQLSENTSFDAVAESMVSVPELGVDFLLASRTSQSADSLTPEFYREVIHQLRLMYDVIILDTSVSYMDSLTEQVAYPEADIILLVTDLSGRISIRRWVEELTTSGTKADVSKMRVVINRPYGTPKENPADVVPVIATIPDSGIALAHTLHSSSFDAALNHYASISDAYFELAENIWNKTPLLKSVS